METLELMTDPTVYLIYSVWVVLTRSYLHIRLAKSSRGRFAVWIISLNVPFVAMLLTHHLLIYPHKTPYDFLTPMLVSVAANLLLMQICVLEMVAVARNHRSSVPDSSLLAAVRSDRSADLLNYFRHAGSNSHGQ